MCRLAWLAQLLITAMLCLPFQTAVAQDQGRSNRILILHDSTDLGMWRDQFDAAFRDFIAANSSPENPLRVSVQYSGMNLYTDQEPLSLINMLQEQHRIDPASLIVAVLPNSIAFMEQYGDQIYPDVPRVYAVPDRAQSAQILSDGSSVVLNSLNADVPVSNTLRLIRQMMPDLETLYIFSGNDNYGPFQRRQVASSVDEVLPDVDITYLTGLPIRELVPALGDPQERAAAYLLSYEVDSEGNMFTTLDVLSELKNKTEIPIFGSFDSLFGQGIVGGNMEFATTRGTEAANAALNLIEGIDIAVPQSAAQNIFDARELERYNFDRSLLPPDAVVEFESFSLWDEYRSQLIAAAVLVGIQTLLIALLLLTLRTRRAAERKSAQHMQELGIQKNLFESVINSIPDAILITDEDRTIYAANKSSRDVFGLASEELIGKPMMELIEFRDDLEREAEHAMFYFNETRPAPIILQFIKADGTRFSGETIGTKIISSAGEVLGYFSLVRDVTQRLLAEEQQQQGQKMEALGNLVGGIAHDFNNVLGVITAYAEINSLTETSPQSKSNLKKIVSATRRGAELCHQILTFSKDMSVEQRAIELAEVVEETFELLRASVPSRIKLKMDRQGGSFPVLANSTQIQQVILNLATNASHAIGEKEEGFIEIGLRQEQVRERIFLSEGIVEPGNYVVLRVADNGCGIPAGEIDQVFEPFYTTRSGDGTGIGLAIVYKIVRAHDGVLNLRSKSGVGTEFEIYLNVYSGVATGEETESGEELICGSGENILLVDDEEELVESLSQLLSNIGYSVKSFTSSTEALDYFKNHPDAVDLLVSDQVMPGLEGTSLLQSIREIRADLPAIICTGHSELLEGKMEATVKIDSVLRKPFTASEFSRNIGNILATRH